ncbi:MAG: hypothetical protein CMM41_10200 [Rhodospirillaceae bacterium]|nr:hypothetical protein [Rhodospirillaceae bacterium]
MVTGVHRTAPFRGIGLMVVSVFFMNLNNALLKWLSGMYPASQIIFMRSIVMVLIVLLLVPLFSSFSILKPSNNSGHWYRGVLNLLNGIFFVLAVTYLPLAETVALTFAAPLFLTALAIPFLGERVGWRRWMAVSFGFLGILIVARPIGGTLQVAILFPLIAALTGAMRDIVTRKLTAEESSLSIFFTSSLISIGGSFPASLLDGEPFNWVMPGFHDTVLVVLTGLCVAAGHYLMIETFRFAEAKIVAPFRYTGIVWATILGFIVWGQLPDKFGVLGVFIIIASGLYILHRQRLLSDIKSS